MADRPRQKKGPLPPPAESSLLGDLESIRALLSGDNANRAADEEQTDVPLLDDVVDGSLEVDESPFDAQGEFAAESEGESVLGDDTIKLLLGDEWRSAAEGIIRNARESLAAAGTEWTDEEAASLARILHDRIDTTLGRWMHEIALEHMADLRSRLLAAINEEVANITDALINDKAP